MELSGINYQYCEPVTSLDSRLRGNDGGAFAALSSINNAPINKWV
jgi:hypothetical protein